MPTAKIDSTKAYRWMSASFLGENISGDCFQKPKPKKCSMVTMSSLWAMRIAPSDATTACSG